VAPARYFDTIGPGKSQLQNNIDKFSSISAAARTD
jgi:molybdenum-dependent DNA-binding transcriptional regulator ModE